MRPRTSAPRGMTSIPSWYTASSSVAINGSPILFFSLLTLSIMRMTIFDPVGIVHAVFAALEDVGRVTREAPGTSRGSAPLFKLEAVDAEDVDVDAAFSSPN